MAEEFPRGQLSTIILMCLTETDKYGYEIIDEVLKKTDGKVSIKQPSLYSSLKRMEEQSLISSYWRDSEIGGRRHYYHLTDLGKKHLEKWQTNITLPIKNDKQETTKVLQQENLFNLVSKPTENEKEIIIQTPEKPSFVQYDLFTQNNSITPPVVDSHNYKENSENQSLPKNENNADFYNIKKFDYVKKGNKSFSDNIKDINTLEEKQFSVNKTEQKKDIKEEPLLTMSNVNNDLKPTSNEVYDDKLSFNKEPVVSEEKLLITEQTTHGTQQENNQENITVEQDAFPKIDIKNLEGYIFNDQSQLNNAKHNNSETKNLNDEKQEIKDDGVLITERLDIKDLPKPTKWESRRYEIYISDNSLSPKFNSKTNENYEDRIKDLYEKSKANAENQELELIDSKLKFNSYKDLQVFYEEQGIKFKPFQKTLYKSEKKFDMIRITKLNMLTSLFMFIAITLISTLQAIIFINNKVAYLNSPLTFLIMPIVSLLVFIVNYVLYNRSKQKRVAFNINKFKFNLTIFLLSLLVIPIILAINLLFGFNFSNFNQYVISIIYPSQIALIYLIYWSIQKILIKLKMLY